MGWAESRARRTWQISPPRRSANQFSRSIPSHGCANMDTTLHFHFFFLPLSPFLLLLSLPHHHHHHPQSTTTTSVAIFASRRQLSYGKFGGLGGVPITTFFRFHIASQRVVQGLGGSSRSSLLGGLAPSCRWFLRILRCPVMFCDFDSCPEVRDGCDHAKQATAAEALDPVNKRALHQNHLRQDQISL